MLKKLNALLTGGKPLTISIQVVPKSQNNQIVSIQVTPDNTISLRIKINKPPEKGQVNEEMIRFLAKQLELPASQIRIASGFTSRRKILIITPHALQ